MDPADGDGVVLPGEVVGDVLLGGLVVDQIEYLNNVISSIQDELERYST